MELVRGEALSAFDRSIDVHVSRIRAAIEDDPKAPRRILTVRGAGYVFARGHEGGGPGQGPGKGERQEQGQSEGAGGAAARQP